MKMKVRMDTMTKKKTKKIFMCGRDRDEHYPVRTTKCKTLSDREEE